MDSLSLVSTLAGNHVLADIHGSDVSSTPDTSNSEYAADEQRWAQAMARAQKGDRAAYQQLLDELSRVIARYLVSRFGFQDFVDDCVQEILLAIHHARHTYEPGRLFRPWLFAIVRNKAIDMLRKRRSYDNLLAAQLEVSQLQAEEFGDPVVDGLELAVEQGQLLDALAPSLKQAVVLTKLVGYSNAEAAERLNISETAVKVRVHRAIAKLKSLLEGDGV